MRILLVVNSFASSVTARNTVVVHRRLSRLHDVELVETNRRGHATRFAADAARRQLDVVVGFGGDGTVNEIATGIAGTDAALGVLPGGSTNVWARTLGIPNDVVDATEHLLRMADQFEPRRVDLGRVDERCFVFAAGIGLDASVVERVDQHPLRKARYGAWYYSYAGVDIFTRRYLLRPPRVRIHAADRTLEGVTVIVQNSDPFTYFRRRPIRVAEVAGLNTGSLGVAVLRSATPLELPTLIPRLLSGRAEAVLRHRQVEGLGELQRLRVEAIEDRPFPVQVDGDYIGEYDRVEFGISPGGLLAVS